MKKKKTIFRWFLFCILLIITLVVYTPIITIVMNSFRSTEDILAKGFSESNYTLETYRRLIGNADFRRYFINSLIVSLISSFISVLVSICAGFALSRFRNRLTNGYSILLLLLQMFPMILATVPLFIVFRAFKLLNTYTSLVILYTACALPFTTWMFRGYFDGIPTAVEEAAWIDGCGRFGSFFRIVLPLTGPGIASVAIFAFLQGWNEFFLANIFIQDKSMLTLPVGISQFIQMFSQDYSRLSCSAVLAMLPTFLFFLFGQKYIVSGAMSGSVKG